MRSSAWGKLTRAANLLSAILLFAVTLGKFSFSWATGEDGADCFCSQILSGKQVDNVCEPVDCYDVLFEDLRVLLFQLIAGQ